MHIDRSIFLKPYDNYHLFDTDFAISSWLNNIIEVCYRLAFATWYFSLI